METTMTIPKEKVLANSQKYFETGAKYNFMPDDLVNFLGTDIITAQASTQPTHLPPQQQLVHFPSFQQHFS